jgi:anti-sigma factor RsiW
VEHLTQKQVEDYSQRQLSATELLAVGDHLGECDVCRRRVEVATRGDSAFFALHTETFAENGNASTHLTAEQTSEYVDKNLSGEALQVVTDHLGNCEQCVMAVTDLRTFRNQIAPSLDREYRPSEVVAPAESSWGERFVSLFRVSPIPAFGGAALAVLLLLFVGWLVWRSPRESERQIAVAPTPVSQPSASPQRESVAPTPEPAAVVARLNDGEGELSLDQEGKLTGADNLPAAYQSLLKKTLTSQKIERSSQLQGLTRPPSSLMGANDQPKDFSALEPVGNVLLTAQPTFRWSTMEGATGYVVEVYDDQFKLLAASPQVTTTSWTTPQSLSRGKIYSWQVKAIKDGQETTSPRPPAPQAKFRILDQAKATELAKAKRAYASSHLTLALLYADAGLLKEAEQELRHLQRANPNSDLARSLLRQIRSFE